jgi:hypothetical protein
VTSVLSWNNAGYALDIVLPAVGRRQGVTRTLTVACKSTEPFTKIRVGTSLTDKMATVKRIFTPPEVKEEQRNYAVFESVIKLLHNKLNVLFDTAARRHVP